MDTILYVTYPLSALLIIALAIGLGVLITRKLGTSWRFYWVGAAVFIMSQVFHIPFNIWGLQPIINTGVTSALSKDWGLLATGILLGLSAGFFEEGARYAAYRWWVKDARTWSKGLLLGAGHGGIEAIFVAVIVLVTFLQLTAVRGQDLSTLVPPEQLQLAQRQVEAYWSAPWYTSLLPLVERALTLPVQISLSLLVLQVFNRAQSRWIWLAVAWHTFVDAVAVVSAQTWGVYITEALLGVFALISIVLIYALYQPDPVENDKQETESTMQFPFQLPSLEESSEKLEDSRYI
jgi:uncharacterized membrane protein YhfC